MREYKPSPPERFILECKCEPLSNLLRSLRLSNPHDWKFVGGKYWNHQTQINIPILIAASYYLEELCAKNGYNKILFTTRDCTHWNKIFSTLFPEYSTATFHTSRIMLRKLNKEYEEYVRSIYDDKSIIVDLNSRGRSYCLFVNRLKLPFNFFTIFTFEDFLSEEQYFTKDVTLGYLGTQLEILNYDKIGSMIDYVDGKVIRQKLEYEERVIDIGHQCINLAVQSLSHMSMESVRPVKSKILNEFLSYLGNRMPNFMQFLYHANFHGREQLKVL